MKRPRISWTADATVSELVAAAGVDDVCMPVEAPASAAAPAAAPRFVIERHAHINCVSLTVMPPREQRLVHAEASVERRVVVAVAMTCRAEEGGGAPSHVDLRLELGEALDPSRVTVQLHDECAYIRLPLAPRETAAADPGDDGSVAETRLAWRAASLRCRERATLCDAGLYCRGCGAWLGPVGPSVASLPDADAASMVDFAQCCQEIGVHDVSWDCIFPTEGGRTGGGGGHLPPEDESAASCYMGDHVLLFSYPLPDTLALLSESAFLGSAPHGSRARWAMVGCRKCDVAVGAAIDEPNGDADGAAPAWFDERVPPDFACNIQLLKCRLLVAPCPVAKPDQPRADAGSAARLFSCYSVSAAVAWRMLRDADPTNDDGAAPRRFALSDGRRRILVTLLSARVLLHTNQLCAAARAAGGGEVNGEVIDAARVLYLDVDESEPTAGPDAGSPAARRPGAPSPLRVSPDEWDEVRAELRSSTELMPPTGRVLRIMGVEWRVGLLPVVPTWD